MGSDFFFFADHYDLLLRFKVLLTLGVTTYVPYLKETKQNKASKILVITMLHCLHWSGNCRVVLFSFVMNFNLIFIYLYAIHLLITKHTLLQ